MTSIAYIILIIVLSNLVVGTLIGISGIAGFLLPLIYVGVLNIPLRNSLALSFISFLVGGIFGTYSYWKLGNINMKFAKLISIGSIIGAIVGVRLNMLIPADTAKLVLYIVVLLSGISILLRKNSDDQKHKEPEISKILQKPLPVIIIGFITAAICSLTGAGGPILVVPLLTILGMNIKVAVGVGIFNQIFIALPSSLGYLINSNYEEMTILIISSLIAHIMGVIFGARISDKINLSLLRKIVSVISITSALYMLISSLALK
ncbi:sulfite exporter TauE/SafE family protein [Brassicibacter mesophilus]|uniref:sulfite exporter TauE/SafE family protein n=1 Tax=Brassicibacter mesophilus TaxID=745119 RepID=UPI003D1B902C